MTPETEQKIRAWVPAIVYTTLIFGVSSISGAAPRVPCFALFDKLAHVVEFSGLETFIDQPLMTYSSGMKLRLGFSVAIHVAPDILLVDEVLSVGDEAFRRKCLERAAELSDAGVTIVFASHDLELIANVCQQVAWIECGRLAALGEPAEVVPRYRDEMDPGPQTIRAGR